jgi:hypothetical protein
MGEGLSLDIRKDMPVYAQSNRTNRSSRATFRLAKAHIEACPTLRPMLDAALHICHLFGRPAFYEMSDRCNLKCEGCYFFDPAVFETDRPDREKFDSQWSGFLAAERARGVSMPYFLGAEPALEEARLITAARYFSRGNIGTNGTVRLDPDIPFRISISAWALDAADDARLRGGNALRKALRLYAGDDRAIVLFTVNRETIDQVPAMARMCRDHGLPLTFSLWSPTVSLLSRLENFAGNDDAFFRISKPDSSLQFDDRDLDRARDVLGRATEDFPETVIYSHAYNRWSTSPGPLYDLDPETGIARDCGSLIVGNFQYFDMALSPKNVKCCTPAVDCQQCRVYSGGWSSWFAPPPERIATLDGFRDWLDMVLTIGRIFLRPAVDPEAFVFPVTAQGTFPAPATSPANAERTADDITC